MAQEVAIRGSNGMVQREDAMNFPAGSIMPSVKINELEMVNMNPNEQKVRMYLEKNNMVIECVGFYARWTEFKDGSDGLQVILITKDKMPIRISSSVVASRLKTLFAVMGLPETWIKPCKIKFSTIDVGNGYSSYGVEFLNDPRK